MNLTKLEKHGLNKMRRGDRCKLPSERGRACVFMAGDPVCVQCIEDGARAEGVDDGGVFSETGMEGE